MGLSIVAFICFGIIELSGVNFCPLPCQVPSFGIEYGVPGCGPAALSSAMTVSFVISAVTGVGVGGREVRFEFRLDSLNTVCVLDRYFEKLNVEFESSSPLAADDGGEWLCPSIGHWLR